MNKTQSIRTYLPALVGVLLARLVAAVPAVNDVVVWLDTLFAEAGWVGLTALGVIESVIVAGVVLGYQWAAQKFGDRLPRIEALLLGSARRPSYDDYTPAHAVE